METIQTYDRFPAWIVLLSNLVSLLIYTSGFVITIHASWIVAILYLVAVLAFEYRLLSRHCINCYYWGKTCGFGRGRLSGLFFKQGDPSKFCEKEMSWKNMIPDLLISIIPLILGIVLIIIKFDFLILFAAIMLIGLTTIGNGFIRGKLTCLHCKQRESGCPAEKLFSQKN